MEKQENERGSERKEETDNAKRKKEKTRRIKNNITRKNKK